MGPEPKLPHDLIPEAIVLEVKPQMVRGAVKSLAEHIWPSTVLVSVAAGVSIASIKEASPQTPVVRVMPNLGALVRDSVSASYASLDATQQQRALVDQLFLAVGQMNWLTNEGEMHLATAISGSGPAYYFALCEAMIAAAEEEGLSADIARALAIGTVTAAGQLLASTPDPRELRESVTSPNGTTAAGLEALLADGTLFGLARKTVRAAAHRSTELSQ